MTLHTDVATSTTKELHVYADGTSGDDVNDGLTALTPKKTLQAVLDLVPDIVKHDTMVHLVGTFTLTDNAYLRRTISGLQKLVIDGGDNWTDTGAGVQTTTAGDATGLDVSGAGWTTDEHAGHFIRILTGDAIGEIRMIQANDADTLEPIKDFDVDPRGSGEATFDIVKPATTITSTNKTVQLAATMAGGSRVQVQRLLWAGGAYPRVQQSSAAIFYSASVIEHTGVAYLMQQSASGGHPGWHYEEDFSITQSGGVSFTSTASTAFYGGMGSCVFQASVFKGGLQLSNSEVNDYAFALGVRVMGGVHCKDVNAVAGYYGFLNSSGHRATKISNAAGPGLLVEGGDVGIKAGVDFSDSSTFGIEARDGAVVRLDGVVVGTGNTTGGLYAHSGAKVFTKSGSVPTLTGGATVELSFDGTTQKAAWSTVNTTPQVEVTTDIILAKAV